MKSTNAKICINCDEIYDAKFCPGCGTFLNWEWLGQWINHKRKEVRKLAQLVYNESRTVEDIVSFVDDMAVVVRPTNETDSELFLKWQEDGRDVFMALGLSVSETPVVTLIESQEEDHS